MSEGYRPKGAPLSLVPNPPQGGTGVVDPEAVTLRRELAEALRLMPTDTRERQQWTVRAFGLVTGRQH